MCGYGYVVGAECEECGECFVAVCDDAASDDGVAAEVEAGGDGWLVYVVVDDGVSGEQDDEARTYENQG